MRAELESATLGVTAPTRIVLLPGAYHGPEDFLREGFVDSVRRRRLPVDLLLVDPELAHLTDRSVLQQLRSKAVVQARAAGCASVWLAGISMGGFLALLYAQCFPGDLDGLCLLAPYLGNRMITSEIARTGALDGEPDSTLDALDEERRIWRYIKDRGVQAQPLYLGFGREDRFAASHRLLAAELPAAAVDEVDGGHDWPVWQRLWNTFLDRFAAGASIRPCP
jgi:enterochelin esterase-like enzyme